MKKTKLVGLEPIQDLIELTLMTLYVKGERTVACSSLPRAPRKKSKMRGD